MNKPDILSRTLILSTAALLLAGTFGAYAGQTNAESPAPAQASFSVAPTAALDQPAWSRTTDRFQAAINGNTVYYQFDSKLIVANASTGKTKWTFANISSCPMLTLNNSVYAATTNGQIVKLSSISGKAIWTKDAPGKSANASDLYMPNNFRLSGTNLYVSDSKGLTQISAVSGKTIRNLPEIKTLPLGISGSTVICTTTSSGSEMRETLEAYHNKTGKRLWEVEGNHNEILALRSGYLYTRAIPMQTDQGYASVIDKVNLKTGKIVKSFNYMPVDSIDQKGVVFTVISGKYVYMVQGGDQSHRIQRIALDAPSDTKPEIIAELNGSIIAFEVAGNRIAALLDNGTLNVLDRDTGNLRTSATVKAEHDSRLTVQNGKVFVESGTTLSMIQISLFGHN